MFQYSNQLLGYYINRVHHEEKANEGNRLGQTSSFPALPASENASRQTRAVRFQAVNALECSLMSCVLEPVLAWGTLG